MRGGERGLWEPREGRGERENFPEEAKPESKLKIGAGLCPVHRRTPEEGLGLSRPEKQAV